VIVIGPGNHYCSVIPNLIVKGIPEAIFKSRAKVVYVCNLVNKKGHTEDFKIKDYVGSINSFFKKPRIDKVIFNNILPSKKLLKKYEAHGEILVEMEEKKGDYELQIAGVLSKVQPKYSKSDSISGIRSFIRHDSDKLAEEIMRNV